VDTLPRDAVATQLGLSPDELNEALDAHSWLGGDQTHIWMVDPAAVDAGFTPVVDGGGALVLSLDADDPIRGTLSIGGWEPGNRTGPLNHMIYRLRGISGGWAAPPQWDGPAHAAPMFELISQAWRHGIGGPPRQVAEQLWLWHLQPPDTRFGQLPDGLDVVVWTAETGQQWLDNVRPGTASEVSARIAQAADATVSIEVGDKTGTGVRVGRYLVVTALHVVLGKPARTLTVTDRRRDTRAAPVTGWVRVELDELTHNAVLARQAARRDGALDFALLVVPDLPNLYSPGIDPAIAPLAAGDIPDNAPLVIAGYQNGQWRLTVGASRDHGRQAKALISPGGSGSPAFFNGSLAAIATGHDFLGAHLLGPPALLAEAIEIATAKAERLGLLPRDSGSPTPPNEPRGPPDGGPTP